MYSYIWRPARQTDLTIKTFEAIIVLGTITQTPQ